MAKAFGATQALRDCSFDLRRGEVHALVGENGCGKSTLVKILSGVHTPDSGTIELAGEVVPPLRTPRAAHDRGIVTVFQEVLVAESRSVLDNVWLGIDDTWRTKVAAREKRTRARQALEELLGHSLDLNRAVEELSLSDRQSCGIVRALLREPKILVLDEATSSLDIATRDRLFALVAGLGGAGCRGDLHHPPDGRDRRDRRPYYGHAFGRDRRSSSRVSGWTPRDLVRLMTGSDVLEKTGRSEEASAASRRGAPVLSVRGLKLRPEGRPIDLEVCAGELIGVAGLEGHGETEFLEALWGESILEGEIVRHLPGGKDVAIRSVVQAADCDVAYVPRERRLDSMFAWMTVRENFAMPTLSQDSRFGWLSHKLSRRRLISYVDQLGIILRSPEDPITTLSGGNQQKVVIARWLAFGPRILLLNDPTRGIDVGAKNDLYALFGALANEGLAIVMLSTELDEQVELMDRVLVFREHELFRVLDRNELSREALVAAFFGETVED